MRFRHRRHVKSRPNQERGCRARSELLLQHRPGPGLGALGAWPSQRRWPSCSWPAAAAHQPAHPRRRRRVLGSVPISAACASMASSHRHRGLLALPALAGPAVASADPAVRPGPAAGPSRRPVGPARRCGRPLPIAVSAVAVSAVAGSLRRLPRSAAACPRTARWLRQSGLARLRRPRRRLPAGSYMG